MRKFLCRLVIAVFILCISVLAGNSMGGVKASKVYQEHWTYELINGDSEVKILRYNDPTVTELVIPSEIEGKQVTQIGEQAFSWYEDGVYFTNLKKVTIPEGVKSIGLMAFYNCIKLESVNLPKSVTSIDFWAFRDCSNLTDIDISSVTSLGGAAFAYCSKLQSITIPGGVTDIPDEAFRGCTSLKSIIIPEGVETIGDLAFADCSALTYVEIPESAYYISDKNPFANCSSLETFKVAEDNGMFYTGDCNALIKILGENENEEFDAIIYSGCKNTVIPESLSRIEINDYAFDGCTDLKSIPFEKIKKIGFWAFRGCSGLTSVTFSKDIKDIPSRAFIDCSGLETLVVADGNADYESKDNTIIKKDTKQVVLGCKNSVIPDDAASIGDYAFDGCSGLESITIPGSVKEIGEYAFEDCTGLTSLTISEGVEKIKAGAFMNCTGLTNLTLPDSLTLFVDKAFRYCSGLKSITIPGNAQIEYYENDEAGDFVLFYGCTSLEEINIGEGNSSYSTVDGVMYNKDKTTLVTYPSTKGGTYTIPETVTTISSGAFADCNNLEEIVLNSKLTSISPDAFNNSSREYTNKIKITVPEEKDISGLGLENIQAVDHVIICVAEGSTADVYLEKYKLQITVVTYPSKNGNKEDEKKEDEKKEDEKKDTSANTPAGSSTGTPTDTSAGGTDNKQETAQTAEIGKTYEADNVTYKVTSATEVTFIAPKSKSIKKLAIPATVTIINKSYNVTAVSKGACKGYKKLTTVTVGSNVKSIGDEAFMNCAKLNKVTVGKNVTSIGKKAFSGDKKLKILIFKGANVKKIGKKALSKVPKKVKITAPKKAVSKYKKLLNKAK